MTFKPSFKDTRTVTFSTGDTAGVEVWQNGFHIKIWASQGCADHIHIDAVDPEGISLEFVHDFDSKTDDMTEIATKAVEYIVATYTNRAISELKCIKEMRCYLV